MTSNDGILQACNETRLDQSNWTDIRSRSIDGLTWPDQKYEVPVHKRGCVVQANLQNGLHGPGSVPRIKTRNFEPAQGRWVAFRQQCPFELTTARDDEY
jgi:hypothetical protein